MSRKELLEGLASYGYPLSKPVSTYQGTGLLRSLLKQSDPRLLEGFPVVLAHLLRKQSQFEWESPPWNPKRSLSDLEQKRLSRLLSLSYLLFRFFGLERMYQERVQRLLSKLSSSWERGVSSLEAAFQESRSVKLDRNLSLSAERLKTQFQNYVVHRPKSDAAQKRKKMLEFELLLSEFFTPRQKELLAKRQTGRPFTKTEREYFYRVVRKRLKALAHEELHQFARSLALK